MLLLSIDFETSWELDTTKTQITEMGAVLYCTKRQSPVGVFSEFVYEPGYPESPPELIELTGIDDALLLEYGVHPERALSKLGEWMRRSDYAVAHNGNSFDKPVYINQCARYGVPAVDLHWIDTKTDILYPSKIQSRKLVHLAAEHGFVNPFSHRALFDAMTTLEILTRYNINEVISRSKEKTVRCIAKVSFEDKDKAKARQYGWDGGKKYWYKDVKESLVDTEVKEAPFIIHVMEINI